MFDLSLREAIIFGLIVAVHGVAAGVAVVQLVAGRRWHRPLLVLLVSGAAVLDAVLLALRGVSIGAVPLTGLFESLVLLSLVFSLLYLLLSSAVAQVWFGSVMIWLVFGMVVVGGFVAGPASRAQALAATPWAIAHAGAMILAAASVVFATAASALYLLGSYRLKHKQITRVLGRIPNMETLAAMNRIGLGLGFVLLTIGLASGLGLVCVLGTGLVPWLTDGKVICILVTWGLLGANLIWDRYFPLKVKVRAYVTIAAFGLVLLATVGVTIAGATQHRFSLWGPVPEVQPDRCNMDYKVQTT